MTRPTPLRRARILSPILAAWALAGCAAEGTPAGPVSTGPASTITPDCAGGGLPAIAGSDDLGCATERNLRAMLADPRDLGRPRDPGPPVGDAAVAAIRRHTAGDAGALPQAATSASQGAVSATRSN